MPLKKRLVEVVRVPFTDGEMLPLLLTATGGKSALTPASVESKCVKLRVEVGICTSCSAVTWRETVEVSGVTSSVPSVIVTVSATSPGSSAASTVRGTAASTSTLSLTSVLKPARSKVT